MWAQSNLFILPVFIDMHLCLPKPFSYKKKKIISTANHIKTFPAKPNSLLMHWRRMLMKQ